MMNTPQHGHYGEWSRPIPAGDDYAAAQEYYRNENYSKAEEILRRHVEDDCSVQPAQEQIASESVLVLYCWCLYQLKRFDDLELKLDAICDERGELRGEILLVWCRLKLQNGGFDLAAMACQRFISEHCDAIHP
ncbi:MAG: hypothetical protein IPG61_02150 [bacterium]|nr:hypothetical protein [bacterium]